MKEPVRNDLAHGILVYADEEPVGWCHFGRAQEVPVPRDQSIPRRMFARHRSTQWRLVVVRLKV